MDSWLVYRTEQSRKLMYKKTKKNDRHEEYSTVKAEERSRAKIFEIS